MEKKIIINKAAAGAAALGLVSGGYVFLTYAMNGSTLGAILNIPLWALKFAACIMIMRYFMKSLCEEYPEAVEADTRKLGVFMALFSAIITSACTYLAIQVVFPEVIPAAMDQIYQLYGNMLDDNSRNVLEKTEGWMAQIQFFSSLIWCILYGSILAVILSSRIPGNDPFKNYKATLKED